MVALLTIEMTFAICCMPSVILNAKRIQFDRIIISPEGNLQWNDTNNKFTHCQQDNPHYTIYSIDSTHQHLPAGTSFNKPSQNTSNHYIVEASISALATILHCAEQRHQFNCNHSSQVSSSTNLQDIYKQFFFLLPYHTSTFSFCKIVNIIN